MLERAAHEGAKPAPFRIGPSDMLFFQKAGEKALRQIQCGFAPMALMAGDPKLATRA